MNRTKLINLTEAAAREALSGFLGRPFLKRSRRYTPGLVRLPQNSGHKSNHPRIHSLSLNSHDKFGGAFRKCRSGCRIGDGRMHCGLIDTSRHPR